MKFLLEYWERDKNNYIKHGTKPHYITIHGKNAKDCMKQYRNMVYTHDLFTYTQLTIEDVTD